MAHPLRFAALAVALAALPMVAPAAPLPVFVSSDPAHDTRLADLFRRHARIDSSATSLRPSLYPTLVPTAGQTLWRVYEVDSMLWFDYSTTNFPLEDRPARLVSGLNMPIDRFGYVYTAETDNPVPATEPSQTFFGYGWPFPDYPQSDGRSVGWEFNGATTEGWTVANATSGAVTAGAWVGSTAALDPNLVSPTFSANWIHAPILALSIQYDTIDAAATTGERAIQVYWQTVAEPFFSEDKSVRTDVFAAIPTKITTAALRRQYLPMYLHPKWKDQTITRLRLDPILNESATPRPASWRLDYVRLSYDTRHSVNNPIYVLATARKFYWDGNSTFLQAQLPRLRAATQFMLTHLRGDEFDLLDQGFFPNHQGLGFTTADASGRQYGLGVGTNYWDLLPAGPRGLTDNVLFYQAIEAMADIEDFIVTVPFLDSPKPTVDGPAGGTVTYAETGATLRARLPDIRAAINAEFWNPTTGRYGGWRNTNGELKDYGYAHWNVEALAAGIPDQAQADSILAWLDGDRTVAGDTSTGADIYHWDFAARATTRRNEIDYFWQWFGWTVPWGEQVQDGGGVLWTTHYDVMGRLRYGDVDGAWTVWDRMLDHHQVILDFGGSGENFYRDYYAVNPGSLQGGGTAGGLGLDVEFIENFIVPSTWPRGFVGIESNVPRRLQIAPVLPPGMTEIGVDNVVYRGNTIKVRHSANTISLVGSAFPSPGGATLRLIFRHNFTGPVQVRRNGLAAPGTVTQSPGIVQLDTTLSASTWTVVPSATDTMIIR